MPPDAATVPATLNFSQFGILLPEILLAFWGLVVLAADLGRYRGLPEPDRRKAVSRVALAGALLTLAASLIPMLVRFDVYEMQSSAIFNPAGIDYMSNPDPGIFFGTLAGDHLTELMNLLLASLLVLVVWVSPSWPFTDDWGEYFALLLWSTVGMMLLVASEELLTLFLTLELMTICLYLMTAFEKNRKRSAEAGLKYFVYGSVSSALFLFGLSLLYGLTGSTHLHAIRIALSTNPFAPIGLTGNAIGLTALLLILVGFGFKIAAVPFHQWAPDAYEGAPAPVTAWIATGSKVASFIALLKVLVNAVGPWAHSSQGATSPGWVGVVAVLSAASMTYGNFAALAQRNFKRMLAYSSIAHAGYMLVGVAAAGVSQSGDVAASAILYYLVTYAFVSLGAFAVASWLARDKGTDEIEDLNGLASRFPLLATCLTFLMLSLIGMPPFAGFYGKISMFMEALNESDTEHLTLLWLVALGLLNSVVSAFYYVRVLKAMYLRPAAGTPLAEPSSAIAATVLISTVVAFVFGVFPAPLVEILKPAAIDMLSESNQVGRAGMSQHTLPGPAPAVAPTVGTFSAVQGPMGMTPPTPPPMRSSQNSTQAAPAGSEAPRGGTARPEAKAAAPK